MRFLFADDHPMFLDAVRSHIERLFADVELHATNSFGNVMDMLADGTAYDLVILDFSMPGMDGTSGLRRIREEFPDLTVAVTSGVAEIEDVRIAIEIGARGFLPKTLSGAAYAGAVRLIAEGGQFVPVDTMMAIGDAQRGNRNSAGLTPRELDVLQGIAEGKPNKQIARDHQISDVTVKVHVRNIFRKLNVRNRSQAAVVALDRNLAKRP